MDTSGQDPVAAPRVVVLLATHNGLRFLPQQLDSILAQTGVSVRVVAMDDSSTDGTVEWLAERASREPRLTVAPENGPAGSSVANFRRLITTVAIADDELVAFADQDDVWLADKLATHAELIRAGGFDGISSSVTSFTESGERSLVRKDYPQRPWDYLLESPGPGCTFLITPRLTTLVAEAMLEAEGADQVDFHDSFIYAVARAHGWTWHIDSRPSVDYRQHDANVMGSNVGIRPALERLKLIREHWLRNHAIALTRVSLHVAPPQTQVELRRILALLTGRGIKNRLALARLAGELRRRPRDRAIIGLLIAIGVW